MLHLPFSQVNEWLATWLWYMKSVILATFTEREKILKWKKKLVVNVSYVWSNSNSRVKFAILKTNEILLCVIHDNIAKKQ